MAELSSWAASLQGHHPLSLLILDEFGPLEARGDGHMKHRESVQATKPEAVVVAVREKVVREFEHFLFIASLRSHFPGMRISLKRLGDSFSS